MKKIKIFRTVTSSEVIPWHLDCFLSRINTNDQFDVTVIGDNVTKYANQYPNIQFIDVEISRKIHLIKDIIALIKLFLIFCRNKPDIIHSIMPKAGLLTALSAKLSSCNSVHTYTGQLWNHKENYKLSLMYWVDRAVSLLNIKSLSDSRSQSDFLYKHKISNNGKLISYLGYGSLSGANIEKIRIKEKEENNNIDFGDKFVYTFLARKTRFKGAFDILYAFDRIKRDNENAILLFIGPDESCGELDTLRKEKPFLFEKVIDIGIVDNHLDYLKITNVLCLPSYREGFGTIVIEAAAMGKCCIGYNIIGLKDAIHDNKTGFLVKEGDIEEYSQKMKSIYDSPELLKELNDNAKIRAEKQFSADYIYNCQIEFYNDLYFKRK